MDSFMKWPKKVEEELSRELPQLEYPEWPDDEGETLEVVKRPQPDTSGCTLEATPESRKRLKEWIKGKIKYSHDGELP